MNVGLDFIEHHNLHTDLKRSRDITGTHESSSNISSSGKYKSLEARACCWLLPFSNLKLQTVFVFSNDLYVIGLLTNL